MRRVLIKGFLAIFLATAIPISIIYILEMPLSELLTLPIPLLLIASLLSIGIVVLKGLRMMIFTWIFKENLGTSLSLIIRGASELIALISPGFTGDEVFRVYYLHKKGLDMGKSVWISYLDIFNDVIVGSTLGMLGGLYLFTRGNHIFSTLAVIISLVIITIHIMVFRSMLIRRIGIPTWLHSLLRAILGNKYYNRVMSWIETRIEEVNNASLRVEKRILVKGLLIAISISLVIAILSGYALQLVFSASGFHMNLLESIFSVHIYLVLTAIPITLGGSGVTEASLALFTSSIRVGIPWIGIVAYRFVTYHITLFFTAFLMLLLISKD